MTFFPFTTPFLDAHPESALLLRGIGNDVRWRVDGEYASFALMDRFGRWIYESREIGLQSLPSFEERFAFQVRPDGRFKDKQFFIYTYRFKSLSYRVMTRISQRFSYVNNTKIVKFSGSNAQLRSVIQMSRRVARSKAYLRRPRVVSPLSSNLRPNPETIMKGYLQTFENNNPANTVVTPLSRVFFTRTWSGVRTPGYASKKKTQLPVNPHVVKMTDTPIDILIEVNKYLSNGGGHTAGEFVCRTDRCTNHYAAPPVPVHLPLARNIAIRRLISEAHASIEANLAQDVAQLGQTVRLIGDTIKQVTGSMIALKNGNIPGAVTALFGKRRPVYRKGRRYQPSSASSSASNWLALQYGWKPLLQDIRGTLEALGDLMAKNDFINTVAASGTCSEVTSTKHDLWGRIGVGAGSSVFSTKTRCKFVLRYTVEDPLKQFMAQTGFTNPVNLAWEVLPFSFVVDWFVPIGPFLETLSSWDGLRFQGGSQTLFTRRDVTTAIDYTAFDTIELNLWKQHRGRRLVQDILLDRTALSQFPTQTRPQYKSGLSTDCTHALNGLALLTSVFKP